MSKEPLIKPQDATNFFSNSHLQLRAKFENFRPLSAVICPESGIGNTEKGRIKPSLFLRDLKGTMLMKLRRYPTLILLGLLVPIALANTPIPMTEPKR